MDFCEYDFPFKRQKLGNKRQRLKDVNENEFSIQKEPSKKFLHLEQNNGVYQTSELKPSKDGDTIYLPLRGDVFVNMERADEITFSEGTFFIGDENGRYSRSVTGTAMYLWKYSDTQQQMIIARSFLITEEIVFNKVKDFLVRA